MKKILVTGGSGFIGSHLVEKLSKKNFVVVLDNFSHGNKITKNKNIQVINGDVRNFELVKKLSKNCSIIFHLAAILGVDVVSKNNLKTMECEYEGLRNICKSAKLNQIKKIIYTSSSGVYGKLNYQTKVKENNTISPTSTYSVAKRFGELYLRSFHQESGISCLVVRPFNIYGPRQDRRMVIPRFIEQAANNKPITIYGDGNDTRDFTYVGDCVNSLHLISTKVSGFEIFNISRGLDYSITDLAKKIKKYLNSKSEIINMKVPNNLKEFQVKKRCGSSIKLYKFTKYKPHTNLATGLKKILF